MLLMPIWKRAGFRIHLLVLATTVAFSAPAQGEEVQSFASHVQPLLRKYCFSCHGVEKQESRIRLDQTSGFRIEDVTLWTKVHEMVAAGDMPPEDQPQPSDSQRKRLLNWIEVQQRASRAGRTRRLNRREISAALQNLTGLSVDYAAGLPEDGKVAGFDTGANGLQDAADSVSQMMTVARRAVDGIRFLDPPPGKAFSADLRGIKDAKKALESWEDQGASAKTRGTGVPGLGLLLEPKWVGERGGSSVTLPVPADRHGVLRLQLLVSTKKYFPEIPNPHLWVEIGNKVIDRREITATDGQPHELVYEVQLDDLAIEPKGVTIELSGRVEVPYAVKGFANEDKTKPEDKIPGGPGLFRPVYNKKSRKPEEQPVPFVVLHQIEVNTDYVAAWPPERWREAAGPIQNDQESAKRLLGLWIERAWRRPVRGAELERFFALYRYLRKRNVTFDDALRATFQSVLLSAPFRYLTSPEHDDSTLSHYAIASRLSFMVVGDPPDEKLLQLAAEGRLRDAAVLNAQVDRLLTDPRSDRFVRPFVTQWLEMNQPITLTMDYFQKQDFRFGRFLKHSMREETISYVAEMFKDNRPAQELIDSNWTMMNNSLAWHYGYEGIEGGRLRQVNLRKNDPRGGGILAHAGIQSMLCWMGDNWVIYRGAWALRHILDDPPPPPPLEVPELDPAAGENRGKTFRELLIQHQKHPKCAMCHRKMDPLGFAFQNFDISGRWRDVEFERYVRNELDGKIQWRGAGKERPVDAAGRLPHGEQFHSFAECKKLLIEHYQPDIVRGILKNLMLYATGRRADVDSLAEIQTIINEQSPNGYRMRDLVKAIVRSKSFLGG